MANLFAKSGDPDHTPQNVTSDLGLHCLLTTLLGFLDINELNNTLHIR